MKHPHLNFWVRLIFKFLNQIEVGTLEIQGPNGFIRRFGKDVAGITTKENNSAILIIRNWGVCRSIILHGDIAFGETYMDGLWDTPDLNQLLWVIGQNRRVLDSPIRGRKLANVLNQIRHVLKKNTKQQAKDNIQAHYDLGNDFYQLWLDQSMTYSSAIRRSSDGQLASSLEEAQQFKISRAITKLGPLNDESTTLEIGCGWGELSKIRLETMSGKHVGITLSQEQKEWARKTLQVNGLNNRSSILLRDYRDVDEQFDGIVSIEMIEAVGKAYWETFFEMIKRSLKPNGRAVIQAITINDSLTEEYQTGVDFIQKYIFPGGMLMSQTQFETLAAKHKFNILEKDSFGHDYAWTLLEWFKRFQTQWRQIEALGFPIRFKRMWEFYLCYCRSGFLNRDVDVVQYTICHHAKKPTI